MGRFSSAIKKVTASIMASIIFATPVMASTSGAVAPVTVRSVSSIYDDGVPDYVNTYFVLTYEYINLNGGVPGTFVPGKIVGIVTDEPTVGEDGSIDFSVTMDVSAWYGGSDGYGKEYFWVNCEPNEMHATVRSGDLVTVYGEVDAWTNMFGVDNVWSTVADPWIEAFQISVYPADYDINAIYDIWHSDDTMSW